MPPTTGKKPISSISSVVDSAQLTGSSYLGNFVWAAAMHIAWRELKNLNGGPIQLRSPTSKAESLLKSLNEHDLIASLTPASYYTKAGLGQETLLAINE